MSEQFRFENREDRMRAIAFCHSEPFDDFDPGWVGIKEEMLTRLSLSDKKFSRLVKSVEGRVAAPDWDLRESRHAIVFKTQFPYWVGANKCVEAPSEDGVFYARVERRGKPVWGRFIRGVKAPLSRSMTTILRPVAEDVQLPSTADNVAWEVVAHYAGGESPAFPGDPTVRNYAASREFWKSHALVNGALPYKAGTETSVCPW
jgi:hypothetical protein